jgi:anaerobic magnesium-protoporphyrin IX monomethyl ester cyclase
MWAYTRVDTTEERHLPLFRKAGIDWLCIGIEAANQMVRREVSKGAFKDANIREVVKMIGKYDINVLANYIIGLPEDSTATMQETLDLAIELNTEEATFSPCTALPGSPLYVTAKRNGIVLPDSYAGHAFYSYYSQPMSTRYCSAEEVLRFRDYAWKVYHANPNFLALIQRKFGQTERQNIEAMARIPMRRKILGDPLPVK